MERKKYYKVKQGEGGLFISAGNEPIDSPNVQLRMPMSLYNRLKEACDGKFAPWIREAIAEKLERDAQE